MKFELIQYKGNKCNYIKLWGAFPLPAGRQANAPIKDVIGDHALQIFHQCINKFLSAVIIFVFGSWLPP